MLTATKTIPEKIEQVVAKKIFIQPPRKEIGPNTETVIPAVLMIDGLNLKIELRKETYESIQNLIKNEIDFKNPEDITNIEKSKYPEMEKGGQT